MTGPALFAYGTLVLPEVWREVTGRSPSGFPAVLHGYARYRLREQPYPGIVREIGARTEGIVVGPLEPGTLARLDRFEDAFYRREAVEVVDGAGRLHPAQAFVIPEDRRGLLSGEAWEAERFLREHGAAFLEAIAGGRRG